MMDKVFIGVIVGLISLAVVVIGYVLYRAADTVGVESNSDHGVAIGKTYHKAFTTTSMVMVGKVMIPQPMYHRERYKITVREDRYKRVVVCDVSKSVYNDISIGDRVDIKIKIGRFSGDILCSE